MAFRQRLVKLRKPCDDQWCRWLESWNKTMHRVNLNSRNEPGDDVSSTHPNSAVNQTQPVTNTQQASCQLFYNKIKAQISLEESHFHQRKHWLMISSNFESQETPSCLSVVRQKSISMRWCCSMWVLSLYYRTQTLLSHRSESVYHSSV